MPRPSRISTLAVLLHAPLLLPACLQDNPEFDPGAATRTETGSSSTGDAPPDPTTGGSSTDDSTSTGSATTGLTSATDGPGSSGGEDESSGGSTGLTFPLCPYAPAGSQVSLAAKVGGGAIEDLTLRPCGKLEVFSPLRNTGGFNGGGYIFDRCTDDACGACDPTDTVSLGLNVPDPWGGPVSALPDGACAQLQVKWERPAPAAPGMCEASTIALIELTDSALAVAPTLLFRRTHTLPVADAAGNFELAAAAAGPGPVACDCESDCCREDPGSRILDFTIKVAEEPLKLAPLESEQGVMGLPLGKIEGAKSTGQLGLVRAFFPNECGGLPEFEWIFAIEQM